MDCTTAGLGRRVGPSWLAVSQSLLALFLLGSIALTACGAFDGNRERCERKCGDDEAIYDPDDDTCLCRSRD